MHSITKYDVAVIGSGIGGSTLPVAWLALVRADRFKQEIILMG
jgi:choline dehydrogenase-like flavoprotein